MEEVKDGRGVQPLWCSGFNEIHSPLQWPQTVGSRCLWECERVTRTNELRWSGVIIVSHWRMYIYTDQGV